MAGVLLVQPAAVYAAENAKEETVYVKTDANGVPEEVIVSDWLKNMDGAATIEDNSDLSDIENVKGEETFSQDGNKLVWNADGSDIYYQGTTTKELPVSVKAAYYLDGREITPQELAGKSGHVKICYTYENTSKSGEVYTPFTMVTGMILPTENFKNTEVKNGKVISDGEKDIVIGIGLPGLAESLKLEDTEMLKDISIPDSFEVEADVTDFRLTMSMTVATTLDLSELGLDDIDSMDDLRDSIDELTDAATQLVDGSGELADGVQTLQDSCVELIDGMNAIDENMGTLSDGISTLNSKKGELIDGINALADGIQKLENSKGTLVKGVGDLAAGSNALKSGAKEIRDGSSQLAESSRLLQAGAEELAKGNGSRQLQAGAEELTSGSKQLEAGAKTLAAGLDTLLGGEQSRQLLDGGAALVQGSADLKTGIAGYTQGAETLAAGTVNYIDNVAAYVQAVNGAINTIIQSMGTAGPGQDASEPKVEVTQQVVTTIDAASVENMRTVLAKLQAVQSEISSATSKEDLIKLYASYGQYMSELNECISLMNGALDGVQEKTIETTAVIEQEEQGSGSGTAGDTQAALAASLKQLMQAGAGLTPDGNANVGKLQAGAAALVASEDGKGTPGAQLNAGAASLAGGIAALNVGVGQVFNAVKNEMKPGVDALAAGAGALSDGMEALGAGLATLFQGAGTLEENLEKFAAATSALAKGTDTLYSGTKDLAAGTGKLNSGAGVLSAGIGQLAAGGSRLRSGAGELGSGVEELADGSAKLKDGTAELADGGSRLDEGVAELKEGADELRDGMEEFNEEGIKKITDFLDEDVQDIVDRLEAVKDAGDAYKLFSESDATADGKVKFIIETGSIE